MDTFSYTCAIPFIYTQLRLSVVDAIFESMSGITTTGSTILNNLDNLPKGILIWRTLLQWLGGIGIVVIALVIFLEWWNATISFRGDDPYENFFLKFPQLSKNYFCL